MSAVEWKKLGDVCYFQNGFAFKSNKFKEEGLGIVRITNIKDSILDLSSLIYFEKSDYPNQNLKQYEIHKGDILIAMSGATTGKIGCSLSDETLYLNQRVGKFIPCEELYNRYLYHLLKKDEEFFYQLAGGGAQPNLSSIKLMDSYCFYLPSLAKQQEIVSHLDTFTTLISNLESELDMRRKQYEHYRNQLLDFEGVEGVEWKTLGEVCIKTENIKWKNATNDYYYIDLSSVERESNRITEVQSICKDNAPSRAQQIVLRNDILFGTTRPTLKRLCIVPQEYDNQICSTGFCVLRANINVISHRLLYYLLTTMSFYTYVENNQEGAGYPSISNSKIMKYEVPVPSLNTQCEIVSKLDAFENLIQSLEQEIKLRKQQYEYYREKLLTFEKE